MEADKHRQKTQAWSEEAWKLRVEGWTQQRIAAKLGVSHQRVSQILQRKEKELHAEFVVQAEEIKARQTERLDHLYDRLTTQFEASCREGSGNPALLAQALKALADQRAIWGVEAPKKSEVAAPGGGPLIVREIVVELPRGED